MITMRKRILSLLCAIWMTLSLCTDTTSALLWLGGSSEDAAEQSVEQEAAPTDETAALPSSETAAAPDAVSGADGQIRTLSASDDEGTCQVTVSIGADADLPENVELVVSEIQEERVAQSTEALGETEENVLFAKSLDISLVDQDTGEVFQPDQDVMVSIQLLDAEVHPDAAVDIVSTGVDAEDAEVMDTVSDGAVVEFVTGDLSAVYTVVVTTRTQTLETTDGQVYKVTVTYDSASGIPEDAEVLVSEIRVGGDEYAEYVSQSVEALGRAESDVLFARAFDITLKNPATGEEYQPDKNVKVSIELLDENLNDYVTDTTSVNVVHFGDETEVLESEVKGDAVEFETSGFSIYVVIGHEGEAEIITPRVEFHFLSENYSESEHGVYNAGAYSFPNKAGAVQTSQSLRNGEALELVRNPENKTIVDPVDDTKTKEMYFFGWYLVNLSSVVSDGSINYTWSDDPAKMPFEQGMTLQKESGEGAYQAGDTVRWTIGGVTGTGTLDSNGITHVYLAPIYEDYYFITFHLGAKDDNTLSSSIYVRKLVVLGRDESVRVRIGEVIAPSSNPKQLVFAGWETVQDNGVRKDFFHTVNFNGEEIDADGNTGQYYHVFQKADFTDLSVDLYPVFYEARWFVFNPGSDASYVGSQYRLTSVAGEENSSLEGSSFSSLPISRRPGYIFDGWYADAAVDEDGNITNLDTEKEVKISYYDGTGTKHEVTENRKAVKIAEASGGDANHADVIPESGGDTNSVNGFQRFRIDANGNLFVYKGLDELVLTARWTSDTVNYTVIYWQENADDDGYSLIHYDDTLAGTAGAQTAAVELSAGSEIYTKYNLKYCALSKDQDKSRDGVQSGIQQQTIAGDGSTIVNVYYDRNRYTLRFDVGFSYPDTGGVKTGYAEFSSLTEALASDGTVYGVKDGTVVTDGECVELTRYKGADGPFFGYEDSENGTAYCLDENGKYVPLTISASTERKLYSPEYQYVVDARNSTSNVYGFVGGRYVPLTVETQQTPTGENYYQLTDTLTSGTNYLIVNRNSAGNGFAFGHSGTSAQAVPVTVNGATSEINNPYISDSQGIAAAKWTAGTIVSGNTTTYTFNNGGYYVKPGNSMSITNTQGAGNTGWTLGSNTLSYTQSTGSGSYQWTNTYYLRYDSSNNKKNYVVDRSANDNKVYFYEETPVINTTYSYFYNGEPYVTGTRYLQVEYTGDDTYRESELTKSGGTWYYHDTEGKYGVPGQDVPMVESGSEMEYTYSYQGQAFSGTIYWITAYPETGRLYKQVTTTGNIYCISSLTNSSKYDDFLRKDTGTSSSSNDDTQPSHNIGRAFVPGEYQSTRTEPSSGVEYTIYYTDLTAKYGENISARWPTLQSDKQSNQLNYGFIGWVTRADCYYWNEIANSSIKGVYETMDEGVILVGSSPYSATTAENGITHELRCRYKRGVHKYVYRAYFWNPELNDYSATPIESVVNSAGDPEHRAVTSYTGYDCVSVKFLQGGETGTEVDITDVTNKDYSYSSYHVTSVDMAAMIIKFWYYPHKWNLIFNLGDSVNEDERVVTNEYFYDQSIASAGSAYTSEYMNSIAPEGHEFDGWYENPDGIGSPFTFNRQSKMPDNNIILYARFKPLEYVIRIDPNGAEIDHIDHTSSAETGYRGHMKEDGTPFAVFNRTATDDRPADESRYNETRATYFYANYDEPVGEYSLTRTYVPLSDAMAASYAASGGTIYYYLNIQYNDIDGAVPPDCRNALYMTEDEIHEYYLFYRDWKQYYSETRPTDYNEPLPEATWRALYVSSQKYRAAYEGENYQLLGWFRVDTNSQGHEIIGNMPFDFTTPVREEFTLRAYWRLDNGFKIEYVPTYTASDGCIINGDLVQWSDPVVEGATYTDGAKTQILQQPTGLTANGVPTEEYIFRGWQLVSMREVNGIKVYTPMETGVYYDPGEPFVVDSRLADREGMIYFQAVYEETNSSYRRPFVTALTLDAMKENGGFVTESDENPLSGTKEVGWTGGAAILHFSNEEEKLVFGFDEDKADRFQSNNTIHLYQYATDLQYADGDSSGKALDPAGRNYFKQEQGDFLLGFDDVKNEGDYIADYMADSVISVPRRDEKTVYAVWEPMVYLNIVNETGTNGGDLTFSLTSESPTALYVVNERTGLFDRKAVSDLNHIQVRKGETLRLAIPLGDGQEVTLNSANNLGRGKLIYWESWIGDSSHPTETSGSSGSASNGDPIHASETLVRNKDGITVVFRAKNADKVLILDDNYTGGRQSEVYFCYGDNESGIEGLHKLSDPYTPTSQTTRLGYECVGWSRDENAAEGDEGIYKTGSTITDMSAFFGTESTVTLYAVWKAKAEASTVYVYKNVPVPEGMSGEFVFAREKEFEFTLDCNVTYNGAAQSYSLNNTYTLKHNQYLEITTEKNVATAEEDAHITSTVKRYTVGNSTPEDMATQTLTWDDTKGTVSSFDAVTMSVAETDYSPLYYETTLEVAASTATPLNKDSESKVSWNDTQAGGTVIFTNQIQTTSVTLKNVLEGVSGTENFPFSVSYIPAGETEPVTRTDVIVSSGSGGTVLTDIPLGAQLIIAEMGTDLLDYVTTAEYATTADGMVVVTDLPLTTTSSTEGGVTTYSKGGTFEVTGNTTVTFTNTLKSVPVKIVKVGSDGEREYKDVEAMFAMSCGGSNLFTDRLTTPVTSSNPRANIVFETGKTYPGLGEAPALSPGSYTLRETALFSTNYVKLYDELTILIEGSANTTDLSGVSVKVLDKNGSEVSNQSDGVIKVSKDDGFYVIEVTNRRAEKFTVKAGLKDPLANYSDFSYSGSYELNGVSYTIDPFTLTAYRTDNGEPHSDHEPKVLSIPVGAANLTITQDENAVYDTKNQKQGIAEQTDGSVYTHAGSFVKSDDNVVTFLNTRKTVKVTVKVEKDPSVGDDDDFNFIATLTYGGNPIPFDPDGDGGEEGFDNEGKKDFAVTTNDSNEGTITLTIPVGANVEIKEDEDYSTTIQITNGTIPEEDVSKNEDDKTVTLTNVPPNDLTVTFSNGSGGMDITFRKINGFGNPLNDAVFTLYTALNPDTPLTVSGSPLTGTSVTTDGKDGIVVMQKVPMGVYFMKETNVVNGYKDNTGTVYKLYVGNSNLPVGVTAPEGYFIQRLDETREPDSNGPDIAKYGILNESAGERKVILKKSDQTHRPIGDMKFDVYRVDMTRVTAGTVTVSASGVFFVENLPYGIYYLKETNVPDGYSSITIDGQECAWFKLSVESNGVQSEALTQAQVEDFL